MADININWDFPCREFARGRGDLELAQCSSVNSRTDSHSATSFGGWSIPMSSREQQPDRCPYCRRLEIACVKFKISHVVMVVSCPNCAMAARGAKPKLK